MAKYVLYSCVARRLNWFSIERKGQGDGGETAEKAESQGRRGKTTGKEAGDG